MNNNEDNYSYNHIIRGYEHTWPGKKEPPCRTSGRGKMDTWHWVCIALLVYSLLNGLASCS